MPPSKKRAQTYFTWKHYIIHIPLVCSYNCELEFTEYLIYMGIEIGIVVKIKLVLSCIYLMDLICMKKHLQLYIN